MLVSVTNDGYTEMCLNGNPFDFEFINNILLKEGRGVERVGDLGADLLLRPLSPYSKWGKFPPLLWREPAQQHQE